MSADNLRQILNHTIIHLKSVDEQNWSNNLKNSLARYVQMSTTYEEQMILYDLLKIYGGMGSFNDLVLHRDGIPLLEENDVLDELRHKLYVLAHERLIELGVTP